MSGYISKRLNINEPATSSNTWTDQRSEGGQIGKTIGRAFKEHTKNWSKVVSTKLPFHLKYNETYPAFSR